MTLITLQDGKIVLRDGKVGTEQECCCGGPCEGCNSPNCCIALKNNQGVFDGRTGCREFDACDCYIVGCECEPPRPCNQGLGECYGCPGVSMHFNTFANAVARAELVQQTLPDGCEAFVYPSGNFEAFFLDPAWLECYESLQGLVGLGGLEDIDIRIMCCLATAEEEQ